MNMYRHRDLNVLRQNYRLYFFYYCFFNHLNRLLYLDMLDNFYFPFNNDLFFNRYFLKNFLNNGFLNNDLFFNKNFYWYFL